MIASPIRPPHSAEQLWQRAQALAGLSLGELAAAAQVVLPERLTQHKGLIGQLLEWHLGADAGNDSVADFTQLGIELKTLPLTAAGKPAESTFVCQINLLNPPGQHFADSVVWHKLRHVLWMPLEADPAIALTERRLASPLLWRPSAAEAQQLQQDWEEFMEEIALGRVDSIRAQQGQYLQVRPKGATRQTLTQAIGPQGYRIHTHPRGFYLRTSFTAQLLQQHFI